MKILLCVGMLICVFPVCAHADTSADATFDFSWSSSGNNNNGNPYYGYEHDFYHMPATGSQISELFSGTVSPSTDTSSRTNSQSFTSFGMAYDDSSHLSGTGSLTANSFSQRIAADKSENTRAANYLNFLSSLNFIPSGSNQNLVTLSGTYTSQFAHTDTLPTTMWAGNSGLLVRHDLKLWGDYIDTNGDGEDDTMQMWNGVIWGYYDHGVHTMVDPNAALDKTVSIFESVDINPLSAGFSLFLDDDDNAWDNRFAITQVSYFNNLIFASAIEEKGPANAPEPVSMLLFGVGGIAMAAFKRKNKSR